MEPHFPMPERKQETEQKEDELIARLDDALSRRRFFDALAATEYEPAQEEYDRLRALNEWRRQAQLSPAREFYRIVENFSVLQEENFSSEERKMLRGVLADRMSAQTARMGARTRDMYDAMLANLDGSAYEPIFDITKEKIAKMYSTDDIEYLVSPSVSMESKLQYLEKQFDKYVAGANALDRFEEKRETQEISGEEREMRWEKLENESPEPSDDSDESKPSMDRMSRLKEGEKAKAIWLIAPARGGYYREKSFDTWDPVEKKWKRSNPSYREFSFDDRDRIQGSFQSLQMSSETVLLGRWKRIAIPYTHEFVGVKGGNAGFRFRDDRNGGMSILKEGSGGSVSVTLLFAEVSNGRRFTDAPRGAEADNERFSDETMLALEDIRKSKKGNMVRARALARYTRERLTYSNDESYNAIYENDRNGYCFAIDTHKQADCDVANTYFAGLCRKLGIPARHTVGHMVKGKYEGDTSAITSGTGHAWTEVWDEARNEWTRVDATPPGDPNMEESVPENEESVPGDYGEQEAGGRSDEELAKLEEELGKHVEQLSYTPAERKLAEDMGIELKEARQIVREIHEAEDTRLPDGRRIADALAQLFDMIVESRKHFVQEYTGPMRRRDGGEHIDDIVRHHIGAQAGETDPLSRAKEKDVRKEEKLFGGFDVHLIGDKSGSMTETVDGEAKWRMQRRALYLILSALHRFEEKLERSGVRAIAGKELDVRTESLSFRGGNAEMLDADKPLSPTFGSADKVKLWHSLTEQGGGNGDVIALQTIRHEIGKEVASTEAGGKKNNRLRIVIAMTDGYPDSVSGVHKEAEELGKLGAVVVGVGLTETAKGVEQIYATPWSKGDYAESIDDLPMIVAKYVILEAIKLFPEKAQTQNKQALELMLREFRKKE